MTRTSAISGALLALFGCAAPVGTGTAPTPDRVLATSDAGAIRDQTRIINPSVYVDARPDSVLRVLPAVYHEVGIDVSGWNPATGEIGNGDFSRTATLGGTVLHELIGCGTTMTGLAADSYHVQMSVVSRVVAVGSGSNVETTLTARAQDRGTSNGWTQCLTTGLLEARINRLLAAKVKG